MRVEVPRYHLVKTIAIYHRQISRALDGNRVAICFYLDMLCEYCTVVSKFMFGCQSDYGIRV